MFLTFLNEVSIENMSIQKKTVLVERFHKVFNINV